MKKLLLSALISTSLVGSASAGTKLQIQLQGQSRVDDSIVNVVATLRNPTAMQFADAIFNCKYYDKENNVVGQAPIDFGVVPWGAEVVKLSSARVNGGAFVAASCAFVSADERTLENQFSSYDPKSGKRIGLGDKEAAAKFWHSDRPIQGECNVLLTEEENNKLVEMRKTAPAGMIILRNDIAKNEPK
jgi:hypothetical protein